MIAGIDFSTRAVDVVTIGLDEPVAPAWQRIEIPFRGDDSLRWIVACQRVSALRRAIDWDPVAVAVIEYPGGYNERTLPLFGAILAAIPTASTVVTYLTAPEWRKTWLGNGRLKRDEAKAAARRKARLEGCPLDWPDDAYDALGVAQGWKLRNLADVPSMSEQLISLARGGAA